MLQGMATDTMDPATAVTWGPFIRAAYEQFVSAPGEVNPATIKNMPAGYTLVRTIQMTDFFGPVQTRVFYGFVAVGGDPKTAVVALRGTASTPNGGTTCTGIWCRSPRSRAAERSPRVSTTSTTRSAP